MWNKLNTINQSFSTHLKHTESVLKTKKDMFKNLGFLKFSHRMIFNNSIKLIGLQVRCHSISSNNSGIHKYKVCRVERIKNNFFPNGVCLVESCSRGCFFLSQVAAFIHPFKLASHSSSCTFQLLHIKEQSTNNYNLCGSSNFFYLTL